LGARSGIIITWRAHEFCDYRPRAPVPLAQFIDAKIRAEWVRDKKLTVFSLFSRTHEKTEVDLFVEAPLDFDKAFAGANRKEVAPGLAAPFVSLEDLLEMKKQAARPKDLVDIEQLKKIVEDGSDG
jgi:hypothetical protein